MQHKLDKEEISKYKILSTSKPCPLCGYHKSNLTEHKKYCKKQTVAEQETSNEENQDETRQDVPEGLNPGGSILLPKFEIFLGKQVISECKKEVLQEDGWSLSLPGEEDKRI